MTARIALSLLALVAALTLAAGCHYGEKNTGNYKNNPPATPIITTHS